MRSICPSPEETKISAAAFPVCSSIQLENKYCQMAHKNLRERKLLYNSLMQDCHHQLHSKETAKYVINKPNSSYIAYSEGRKRKENLAERGVRSTKMHGVNFS